MIELTKQSNSLNNSSISSTSSSSSSSTTSSGVVVPTSTHNNSNGGGGGCGVTSLLSTNKYHDANYLVKNQVLVTQQDFNTTSNYHTRLFRIDYSIFGRTVLLSLHP
jgi:hypothetical protein